MSVTIIKGVTLATFSSAKAAANEQKSVGTAALSLQSRSAQAAARQAADVAVSAGRFESQSTIHKIRDHAEASDKAEEVADQIREQEDHGEESHANLDPALVPDGWVV